MRPEACPEFRRTYPTRRHVLQAGALGLAGLSLPDLLARDRMGKTSARARSVILLFMWGGPSHLDTWDPKPQAPAEIRGEFQAIRTSVPGLIISEHFPRLARLASLYAVVRSMSHTDPAHLSPVHHLMTGHVAPTPNSDAAPATRNDHPHLGAMLARWVPSPRGVPTCVQMPWLVSHPAAPGGTAPGQHAGWLGSGFDPFLVSDDPNRPGFRVAGLNGSNAVTVERHELLRALDRRAWEPGYDAVRQRAFDLLMSEQVVRAFELDREPPNVRDRYGRHTHGQACLLARRLIEAGVRLVCVHWHNDGANFWDTHVDNFNGLKKRLMPPADQAFSALLEDLDQSGLLQETLVVWVGEFGRHPKITAGNAGREHWPFCYSAVLAGAGVRGGTVYGASDKTGAYPATPPVSPADLTATIAYALGLDPHLEIRDRLDRPMPLVRGNPLLDVWA